MKSRHQKSISSFKKTQKKTKSHSSVWIRNLHVFIGTNITFICFLESQSFFSPFITLCHTGHVILIKTECGLPYLKNVPIMHTSEIKKNYSQHKPQHTTIHHSLPRCKDSQWKKLYTWDWIDSAGTGALAFWAVLRFTSLRDPGMTRSDRISVMIHPNFSHPHWTPSLSPYPWPSDHYHWTHHPYQTCHRCRPVNHPNHHHPLISHQSSPLSLSPGTSTIGNTPQWRCTKSHPQ